MNKKNTIKWTMIDSSILSFFCLFFCLIVSCGGDDNSVADVAVRGVSLSSTSLTMPKGTISELQAFVTPSNATNKDVVWVSSDTSVAAISKNGVIMAISPGTAVISVVTMDGQYKAECNVTVVSKVESITLNKTVLTIVEGGEEMLIATILPEEADNKNVIWKSADESVAKVSSAGLITAMKMGKTIITATTEDGHFSVSCSVTVESGTNIDYNPYSDKQNW